MTTNLPSRMSFMGTFLSVKYLYTIKFQCLLLITIGGAFELESLAELIGIESRFHSNTQPHQPLN